MNHVTKPDAYPMPQLDDLIETIGRCQYISSFDLTKGFWQVALDPKDQEKITFCSPLGLFEFRVMSLVLKNAPATFQRLTDKTLQGLGEFTVAYMYNIGIYSQIWEEHKIHLETVLQRLHEAGLTVKASKCQLGSSELKYLGHLVGGGIIKPLESKIEAINNWAKPTSN